MPNHGPVLTCQGPDDPPALDDIPVRAREGNLDAICPTCHGRGQWNREIYGQGRTIRHGCDQGMGLGWLETGDDAIAVPDIILGPNGGPKWITRLIPAAEQGDYGRGTLLK
jgi:hypothetical protein